MTRETSSAFKYMIDSVCKGNSPPSVHHWTKVFMVHHIHKRVVMDSIIPGTDQEVLRKIYHCVVAGKMRPENIMSYGVTIDQLTKYLR
jgi:hypothetical protein